MRGFSLLDQSKPVVREAHHHSACPGIKTRKGHRGRVPAHTCADSHLLCSLLPPLPFGASAEIFQQALRRAKGVPGLPQRPCPCVRLH